WKNHKINIIDVPGYFDFVGEVKQGTRVSDGALIIVSAKSGVEVGTEKAGEYAEERKIPRMFFINKMDEENADFDKVFNQLRDTFGNSVIAAELPIIEGGKFTGSVNVVSMKAYKFGKDKSEEIEIPSDLKDKV